MIRPGKTTQEDEESVELLVQDATEEHPTVKPKVAATTDKILFLDGVRGLAALLVVVQHSHEYMQDLNLGACAVDAFFVLSSFLLTMLFMKKSIKLLAQDASYRKWAFTLADYFSKRFFRVYPLFALVILVLWMLPDESKTQFFRVEQPETFDLFKVLTFDFDHRYFVFWTLPLEIAYYFFIPAFILLILRLRKFWWIPLIPAYAWITYEGWYTMRWNNMGLSVHFPTFLAGSLAAVILVKLENWIKTTRFEPGNVVVYSIRLLEYTAVSLLLSLSFKGLVFTWMHANIAPDTPGFPFVSILLTVVFVIEILFPSGLSTFFEWSALRYCGKVSFSLYLLHGFVVYADFVGGEPGYYDRWFSTFGLTLLLATVSYHLVEYPSQLLARYISTQLVKREKNIH
ncbi:putative O-acetyltransferase [Phytophthora citrophthora]|uniref:O-acetyltransferase n=1 Tax=Phytophthora citrophthora TaxID=4793 RepID=A0AAD9LJU9_9STRA|nr:putative O-acetyltransferase [Phytophthora citrophthora]